jgi:hypothetical protein
MSQSFNSPVLISPQLLNCGIQCFLGIVYRRKPDPVRSMRKEVEPKCDIPNPCVGIYPSCHISDIRARLRQVAQASWGETCLEGRYRKSSTELFEPCSHHTPTPNEALEIPLPRLASSPSPFSLICTQSYPLLHLPQCNAAHLLVKLR